MLIRLTRKLAELVDGVDLSHCSEGDVLELPRAHAELLIAEGWAVPTAADAPSDGSTHEPDDGRQREGSALG